MSIIKKQREAMELSRRKLAKRLGVSLDTIVRWEKKTHPPKLVNLPSINKELGITYKQLVDDYKEE